ncbi:uncharacterized protein DUF4231 [Mycoplasma testudineum]|uniref:Uncharacterized protein DUF4231 n=1 Tax=Mycoplasma testudineum TaxID=244584 RepID=A0A4R6IB42_9MOLU|nr:DUF4231 domain-containing protein [Mycoplasma testudineum]OYD26591.1 hypothetical protein CG473_03065 [Mycoplasma testudineum]TDO19423.1 uncharacterized protein DUF4231 [Mycoplasma testudineum]
MYFNFFMVAYKRALLNSKIYRVLFFLLNLISFSLILYSAVISVLHLAVVTSLAKSAERVAEQGIPLSQADIDYNNSLIYLRNLFTVGGAGESSFPIYTTMISASSSIVVSLISFFYIDTKYKNEKQRKKLLEFEKIKYEIGAGKYSDEDKKDMRLYEVSANIVSYIDPDVIRGDYEN